MCSVLPLEAMLMFKIQAAIKDHVDVCGPCCDWRLCGCLRSILSKEPMLIPTVQVTTKGHVDVCGLGPLEAMLISVAYAVVEGHYGTHGLCVDIQGLYYL